MSVWGDIRHRAYGTAVRMEDKELITFRLNNVWQKDMWKISFGEKIVFNKGTENECIGEYITDSRISREPIFKLIGGNRNSVANGVTYTVDGIGYKSGVTYVTIIEDFYVNN